MDNVQEISKKSKILIVDDNLYNIQLLEMLLDMEQYEDVRSTRDPRQVVALHQEHNFDLILLDIRMPHMDGFQVMEALENIHKNDYLPIIVLTAQIDMETRLRALKLGAKDFITKPFDRLEVLLRIKNMLEVRYMYNQQSLQAEILERKVRERTDKIKATRLEIIQRLGRAGEYRDNETGMHVIRMSKGCHRLALAAGLNDGHAEKIFQASPMHDVGKIGIPDNILLKPGKLAPEEWEIMKTHAEIGSDIIGRHDSGLMTMAREIALNHHEKWDGSGYPRNLREEQIPIEGRIAAICDVFDALTSKRPYKEPWPVEKALAFVQDNSGKHFDPRLVEHFTTIYDQILKIRDKYTDEK